MNISVDVKISSPELMASILALAEALQSMKIQTVLPVVKEQTLEIKAPEMMDTSHGKTEVKETTTVGINDVRSKLASLSQSGKHAEAKALLKKFGGNKLTDIGEEHYAELLKEAEAMLIKS